MLPCACQGGPPSGDVFRKTAAHAFCRRVVEPRGARRADPTKRNPPGAGLSAGSKADFPPEKQAEFGGEDRGPPGAALPLP